MKKKKRIASGGHQPSVTEMLKQAVLLHSRGDLKAAEAVYNRIIKQFESDVACSNLAVLYASTGRQKQSIHLFKKACQFNPAARHAFNLGNAYFQLGDISKAKQYFSEALVLDAAYAPAHNGLGNIANKQAQSEQAIAHYRDAISADNEYVEALNNLANVLKRSDHLNEALSIYQRALSLVPDNIKIINNYANTLLAANQIDDAITILKQALSLAPLQPETLNHLGNAYKAGKQLDAAINCYQLAVENRPGFEEALMNKVHCLVAAGRLQEALGDYQVIVTLSPENPAALLEYWFLKRRLCDWQGEETLFSRLIKMIESRCFSSALNAYQFLMLVDDPALQLKVARCYHQALQNKSVKPLALTRKANGAPLRIGYLSSDFRDHPMSYLLVELFESHDKTAFETYGFSLCHEDIGCQIQERVQAALDHFHILADSSDRDIATFIANKQIDILVDLNGLTLGGRPNVLAYRPAAVQVHYMGFAGSQGNPDIDYLIADPCVVPDAHQSFFDEKIAYLPDCYWVSDRQQMIAAMPDREAHALPAEAFIFVCFNRPEKISASIFAIWMKILSEVEGSVLWLLADTSMHQQNLQQEAEMLGVDRSRLIFAEKLPRDQHLARLALADLMLDTLPYNGHTTTCDALAVNVPVVTLEGQSFASRVSSSMLKVLQLNELVCLDAASYESRAIELANGAVAQVKSRLANAKLNTPLFDTPRFTRHLERAFLKMHETAQQGAEPETFYLPG